MNQIIIEHYKNSRNFLSLKNFKIPFIIDNGLYFNEEQVYRNINHEEGILTNEEEQGFWVFLNIDGIINLEGFFKDGKQEGLWIEYYQNIQPNSAQQLVKKSEKYYINGEQERFWIEWYKNGQKKEFLD